MAQKAPIGCDELRRLYEEERLSVAAIAAQAGCSPPTVSRWLRRCGISTRSGRFTACEIQPELLRQLYLEECLPLRLIAARLGVSVGTIHNRRRALGLPPRGRPRVRSFSAT